MDSIKSDSRFSHIASDPRFRPMPKSKKKVKIDSRFQSIFTSKDFAHRTDIDKRGRPLLNGSKKQKNVMERFYDLSESEPDQDDDDLLPSVAPDQVSKKEEKGQKSSSSSRPTVAKKRKKTRDDNVPVSKSKRKRLANSKDEDESSEDNSYDETSAAILDNHPEYLDEGGDEDDETNSDSESGDKANEEEEDEDVDEDLIEYTQDHELDETTVDHKWNELQAEAPTVTDSTRRLAVCNMDWDFVKAQDLYVLFKSFVPEGGAVKSVAIYPSEFGKERMSEEALLGPKELRVQHKSSDEEEVKGANSTSGKKGKKQKSNGGDQQKSKRLEKEKESVQREKLREYQLNRMRYYYAVVECDTISTADNIYTECDGREFQLSSVRIDLRFIPDDMTFDDEPKERFSEDQGVMDYQPSKFNSTALSQAKVEITWDETEFDRLSRRMSAFQQKELQSIVEENKYTDIIAPPESDSEGEGDGRPEWLRNLLANDGDDTAEEKAVTEAEKIRLYRKVLMDKLEEDEEKEKKEEGELDKEIDWQPGLKSAAEKKMKKQEKKKDQNAIVGDYLEKKKEKKKKKKEEKMKKIKQENGEEDGGEETLAFSDDELPAGFDIEDMKEMLDGDEELLAPAKLTKEAKKKKKKGKKGQERSEVADLSDTDEKARAELELILMDGDSGHQKKPAKPEVVKDSDSKKKKKKSKLAKLKKTEEDKEDFVLDMEDPRFSALYSSHHFHIDPSAPQFKKTKNMLKLVDEQIKQKNKKGKKGAENGLSKDDNNGEEAFSGKSPKTSSTKSMSQTLLESLKRKMKK